jgi:PhnB protein
MAELDAYLFFDGNCADAMRFYEKTLGGSLEGPIMTYGQAPGGECPPGAEDRVMHASMMVGGRRLMASDSPPGRPHGGMHGFALSLNYDGVDEARRMFDALADGGSVTMPFAETFWTKGFGMLTDRFGTPWMVNVNHEPAK